MSELTQQQGPMSLLSQAIEKGTSIDQLKELMDLYDRWQAKQSEKAFNIAKAQFQQNKPEIKKTKKVSFVTRSGDKTEYSYAPLPEIQAKIDPVLSRFGLSYSFKQDQVKIESEGKVSTHLKITCVVTHVDGHKEETHLVGPSDNSGAKNALQAIGSTVTFLQRYTLCNAFGLSSDEDNDGASVLTQEDLSEAKHNKIVTLAAELHGKLTENDEKTINDIIVNRRKEKYNRAITLLQQKKDSLNKPQQPQQPK